MNSFSQLAAQVWASDGPGGGITPFPPRLNDTRWKNVTWAHVNMAGSVPTSSFTEVKILTQAL